MLTVILLAFLLLLAVYMWKSFFSVISRSLPPGPSGLPVVGNLLPMLGDPPKKLMEWSKTYGRTVGVYLGSRFMVVIHDPDLARSVLADENTTGRDQKFLFADFFKGRGLLMSEGELWKEQRRFALTSLRNLGMGKSFLEEAILGEVADAIKTFRDLSSTSFDPRPHLTLSVSNVICALVFGKRFDHTDEKFIRLCGLFGENIRLTGDLFPVLAFPWLKHLRFGKLHETWKLFCQNFAEVRAFSQQLIDEHKTTQKDSEDVKEDYINGYLAEQAKQVASNGNERHFEDDQLLFSVLNLFAAGTETTTSSLLWSFIFMVQYPDIQTKVQAEIDAKIGRDRPIGIADKGQLKYTEATLFDVQRLASIVPISVSHTNLQATKIDGFDLPERSLINVNSYAIHRDTKYWKNPLKLYPEHFLDSVGNIVISKGFLPFGVGKRACAGESLAKMELYLYFANILQKFRIKGTTEALPDPENVPVGLLRPPPPFHIRFIARD